jgi:hypothetical protein
VLAADKGALTKIPILLGLCLGMGIASLSGCTQGYPEANAPPAAEPTPLIPQAYAAPQAAAAPIAYPPPPAMPPASLMPVPAAPRSPEGPAGFSPAMMLHPYHPHWMIDVH